MFLAWWVRTARRGQHVTGRFIVELEELGLAGLLEVAGLCKSLGRSAIAGGSKHLTLQKMTVLIGCQSQRAHRHTAAWTNAYT